MYEELLQVNNGNIVTTSLNVAEKFDKSHKTIIQKIESLIKELEFCFKLSRFPYFEKSSYVDDWNRTQTMYLIDHDGLLL